MIRLNYRSPGPAERFLGDPLPPPARPQRKPSEREQLLAECEAFLRRTRMPESIFGIQASGNASLIRRMRDEGMTPRAKTAARVRAFIAGHGR